MRICLSCIVILVFCATEIHGTSPGIVNVSKKPLTLSSITTTTFSSVSGQKQKKTKNNNTIGSGDIRISTATSKTGTANLSNLTSTNKPKKKVVIFWERADYEGSNITRTYADRCENLGANWIYRAKSMRTFGQCINVYTKLECEGDSGIIQNDENVQKFLGKFANKIASFRKCSDDSQRIKLGVRPEYNVTRFIDGDTKSYSQFPIMSGVCTRLPAYTNDDRFPLIYSNNMCLITWGPPGCNESFRFYLTQHKQDNGLVSFKTCDLSFRNDCAPPSFRCPKFITKGSVEYNFWKYLFSIYPRHYRKAFEERVNASKDGFISWDFLFSGNTSAPFLGDQYLDAIESQINLFRELRSTQSGTLGFDEKNVITLRALSTRVYFERLKQFKDYKKATNTTDYFEPTESEDHTLEVFRALEKLWDRLDGVLSELINYWISKRGDAKQRQVKFGTIDELWESEKRHYDILYAYEDKCVNLRPDWINKTCTIDTFGHCVTLYSEANCGGTSVNMHPLGKGYHDLFEIDFCRKTASFKQCAPITEIKSDQRPAHHLHPHNYRKSFADLQQTTFKSDECVTTTVHEFSAFFFRCFISYDDEKCEKKVSYYYSPDWKNAFQKSLFYIPFQSLKLCDLNVTQSNSCEWCPRKLLSKGSPEYVFWWYLFSIYSPKNRQRFTEQFESTAFDFNGYIKWDFLFEAGATKNLSSTNQYADALNSQFDMLRSLYPAVPGTMGFNVEHLKTLSELASRVYDERRLNARKGLEPLNLNTSTILEKMHYGVEHAYLRNENDRYNVAFLTLLSMWAEIQESLTKVIDYWNAENKNGVYDRFPNSKRIQEVTFWEGTQYKGASISYNYTYVCVNVNSSWVNRANSLDTKGECINVYTRAGCKGDSEVIQDSMRKLVNKVASFKKCDPKTLIKLVERPRYFATIFNRADFRGQKEDFSLLSGECLTLPTNWHGRVSSIDTRQQCFILFDEVECRGNEKYSFPTWITQNNLRDASFQGKIKSIKTCEIKFDSSCRECPQLIEKFGLEYNFWGTLFSVYSRSFREQFEERVKRAYEGFISWDFISSSNATAENLGDQYQDVLENHLRLLRIVQTNRPGLLNFNFENVQTLLAMVQNIQKERKEEWLDMLKNGQDGTNNFVVLYYLETIWKRFEESLTEISRSWYREDDRVDICGLVERKEQPEETDLTDTLIYNGDPETYGDDPWHVAIYRIVKGKDPRLICGGTLISSTVVVSAAHCFYYKHLKTVLSNVTSEFEIYVGKFSTDYDAYDGPFQKRHEIAELIFNEKKYNPDATKTFGSDIVLIVLDNPIAVNSFVRPICLDWDNTIFGSLLGNNPIGRIVGWGSIAQNDENLEQSEYLRKAELVYINHEECAGKTEHLSRDNFCGVSPKGDTGPSARRGDSGGGFVFKYKGRYYLRGIVSTRDKYSKMSINAFTDVSEYISWIRYYV